MIGRYKRTGISLPAFKVDNRPLKLNVHSSIIIGYYEEDMSFFDGGHKKKHTIVIIAQKCDYKKEREKVVNRDDVIISNNTPFRMVMAPEWIEEVTTLPNFMREETYAERRMRRYDNERRM